MAYMTFVTLIGGLIVLVIGGELLIKGASRIATGLGVSSLVVGLTIVAFGTSAPELVVSLKASFGGNADIAMANVVGSNLFNTLLILGACAAIAPLVVASQLVRLDVPVMLGASILMFLFSLNYNISFVEGLILFSALIIYTVYLIKLSRKESQKVKEEYEKEFGEAKNFSGKDFAINGFYIVIGLVLLIFGGRWFVNGAIEIAKLWGVSDTVIGLTIVAAGTSLPEVATSIIATFKGERDIAVGNVVGSNIYNIFCILGLTSMLTPGGLSVSSDLLALDIPIVVASAIICLPVFMAGFKIDRWKGVVFLAAYVLYTAYLILFSTQHSLLAGYQKAMFLLILPAFAVTSFVIIWQAAQSVRQSAK